MSAVDQIEGGAIPATVASPAAARPVRGFRPATRAELRPLARILRETIEDHPSYSPAHRVSELKAMSAARLEELWRADPRNILVGTVDGAIGALCIVETEHGVGWIRWGIALPAMRRSGISFALGSAVVETARARGMTKLLSVTRVDNRASIALIRHLRFRVLCELKAHWFGEDFLMWELLLDPPLPRVDDGHRPGIAIRLLIRARHALLDAFQSAG